MSPFEFTIREAGSEAERVEVSGLLGSEFDVRPGVGKVFQQTYVDVLAGWGPPASSRVAIVDDQIVGHALLVPRTFCFDGIEIPGGIVAMVVVSPRMRGMGVGSALVADAEALAISQGLMFLHIAGDRGFYGRMGYVEGYLSCRTHLRTESGSKDCPVLCSAGSEDIEALVQLSATGSPNGSVRVDADRWRWVIDTGYPSALVSRNERLLGTAADENFLLVDENGTVGVIRAGAGKGRLIIYEAWSVPGFGDHLLESAMHYAHERGFPEIALHLPPNSEVTRAAVVRGGDQECEVDPQLLGKVLDPPGMLERLLTVFSHRLSTTRMAGWKGQLDFRIDDLAIAMAFSGEGVGLPAGGVGRGRWEISLPGIALTRALLGTDRFVDRAEAQIGDDGELRLLLDTLFPQKAPYFWLADSL
jgi:predicted N-acetyltransferase YhbS